MKQSSSKEVVFPGQRFCRPWWNHMLFRFFRAAIWMVCLFRLFFPSIDTYLGMINGLQESGVVLSGVIILTLGFVFTITIHFRLGNEWRSGIDPNGPNKLISDGMYKYSRNPMFAGVALAQFGFFLALPSFFSLVCLAVGLYTLNNQASAEEKHLLQIFPQEYKDYSSRVRRWI